MTVEEFKAWVEGFVEGKEGLTQAQLTLLVEKLATVDVQSKSHRSVLDDIERDLLRPDDRTAPRRFWPHNDPVWRVQGHYAPSSPMGPKCAAV